MADDASFNSGEQTEEFIKEEDEESSGEETEEFLKEDEEVELEEKEIEEENDPLGRSCETPDYILPHFNIPIHVEGNRKFYLFLVSKYKIKSVSNYDNYFFLFHKLMKSLIFWTVKMKQ